VPVQLAESLDAYAARWLGAGMAPAAAVALVDSGGVRLDRVYGAAREGQLFEIGSIGKSFTAVVAVQLAAEGLLDLHAPVDELLPWFSLHSSNAPITLHHLLTHTAGLIRGSELATASNYDALALAETEVGFAPGEHFWYSNVGYRVVGLALERASGRPYPELVQRRVLDPLEMRDSVPAFVHDTRRRLAPGHVAFYDDRPWRREHGLVPATWIESAEADGSVCCTAPDLGRYLHALMTSDERVLSPEGWAQLRGPHVADDQDGRGGYGYGVAVQEDGFGHGGGMIGYVSTMWATADAALGAVALVNGPHGSVALADALLALAAGREPPDPEPEAVEPLVGDGTAPAEQAAYVGHYRAHNPWLSNFRVAARAGRLWFGTDALDSERHPLTPLEDGGFRVGEQSFSPERLRFDTLIDGHAQRAVLSGAPYYRTFTP
jgi:CubicO group peptidase (beta-lactamase class C family)